MPAWIHAREKSLEKDMAKTYGPEKAKQVAWAVATQQAHKLGKSPKSYGTVQGRREAKVKFDKPKSEYQKTAAALPPDLAKRMKDLQSKLSVVQPNALVRLTKLQKETGTLIPKISMAMAEKTAGLAGLPSPRVVSNSAGITGALNSRASGVVGTPPKVQIAPPQKGLIGTPMASKSIPMKSMGGAGSTLASAKGVAMPTVKVPASAPVPAGLKKGGSLSLVRFNGFVDEMLKIAGNGATRLAMDVVEEATDQLMRRPALRAKLTGKALPKEKESESTKPERSHR
jgi:hypothetical protein